MNYSLRSESSVQGRGSLFAEQDFLVECTEQKEQLWGQLNGNGEGSVKGGGQATTRSS